MNNPLTAPQICDQQNKMLEKLKIPNKLISKIKHMSQEQLDTVEDVLKLLSLDTNDRDFGAKSLMTYNVAILSMIMQDILKNFNFSAKSYNKNDPGHQKLIDSVCKVIETQNKTLEKMKNITIMGAPSLHVHHHAKGVPSFHENAVVILPGEK
jgi:hypothetical protein